MKIYITDHQSGFLKAGIGYFIMYPFYWITVKFVIALGSRPKNYYMMNWYSAMNHTELQRGLQRDRKLSKI